MLKQNLSHADVTQVPRPQKSQHKRPDKNQAASSPSGNSQIAELSLSELEQKLNTSPDGLSQAEAEQRLAQVGYNELTEKKQTRS